MEGVHLQESPFGYWYNCLEAEWQPRVIEIQEELRQANKPIDVFVFLTQTATGIGVAYYTPCDRKYRPPGWEPLDITAQYK